MSGRSEIVRRFGFNVRRLRKQRRYTQERLGKLCGFTKSYISNMECGIVNITLDNLEAIAVGLGCASELSYNELFRRMPAL